MQKDTMVKGVGLLLALYAGIVVMVQFFAPNKGASLPQLFERQSYLGAITNDVARDSACIPLSGYCRNLALALPENARVYVPDMLGPENTNKGGYYFFLRYYLFPREVAISLGGSARQTANGFTGIPAKSDEELRVAGFDVVVDFPEKKNPTARTLRALSPNLQFEKPLAGSWDWIVALLLPLLVAFMGLRLLKFAVPALVLRMSFLEALACGFGVGMMVVASLTLGVKLTNVIGLQVVPLLVVVIAIWELWVSRSVIRVLIKQSGGQKLWHPVFPLLALVLILFFRLACLEGLLEFDGVAAWMTKGRIIYLTSGDNLIQLFSDPTLAHAHLDYPTLVPALQATTWGALGRVNEFVTKCWPVWQWVFMLVGIGAVVKIQHSRWGGPAYWMLALTLLPATVEYVRWEGATIPMVFFTTMGMIQMVIALQDQDRDRLVVGMLLLFGAAMTKFEGVILFSLALVGVFAGFAFARCGWSRGWWRALLIGLLSLSAFAWLRLNIPVLHNESFWARDAIQHFGTTMLYWPQVMAALLGACLVNSNYAAWTVEDGHLSSKGCWEGMVSLIHQPTLGLIWVIIIMTLALWVFAPQSRRVIAWVLWVTLGGLFFLAFVFAALGSSTGLEKSLNWIGDTVSGRYMLPMLIAWGSVIITILYRCNDVASGPKQHGL